MAGLSKRNLNHNWACIKEICTGKFCHLNAFSVLVNWHLVFCWFAPCSQANQPMIQKLEETWSVKIISYRTFHGIGGLSFRSNFYIHCHLKILVLTETAILIFGLPTHLWQDSQASQSNNLSDASIMGLSLLSLPKVAYHTTNNPIHVFFSYVFLTYAFRQYQISPKISFFTSTSPLALCLPFIYSTLKSLAISPRYISGGCLFLSHMQVPLFWIKFCVKILQLSFSIYFLKIWSWMFVKLLFLFIYWGTPPCDHTVYTTTSLLIP